MHAVAMPEGETWDAAAIAGLLSLPGTLGLVDPGGGMVLARVAADEAEILALVVIIGVLVLKPSGLFGKVHVARV